LLKDELKKSAVFKIGWNPEKLYLGFKKPSPRKISTELIGTKKVTPDADLTHMVRSSPGKGSPCLVPVEEYQP
jgi:hypothetical protein